MAVNNSLLLTTSHLSPPAFQNWRNLKQNLHPVQLPWLCNSDSYNLPHTSYSMFIDSSGCGEVWILLYTVSIWPRPTDLRRQKIKMRGCHAGAMWYQRGTAWVMSPIVYTGLHLSSYVECCCCRQPRPLRLHFAGITIKSINLSTAVDLWHFLLTTRCTLCLFLPQWALEDANFTSAAYSTCNHHL